MRNSGKTLLGLVLQQEGAKISNGIPCLLPERELAPPCSPSWSLRGDGRVDWGRARGVA